MQYNRFSIIPIVVLLFGLAACQQSGKESPVAPAEVSVPQDSPAPDSTNQDKSAPVSAPAMQSPIAIEPASLTSCDVGAVVTVKWDIRTDHPDVKETEVWTGSASHELTLFAASGPAGDAQTGAWAAPGSIFAIKDRATGKELARATVQGPSCN